MTASGRNQIRFLASQGVCLGAVVGILSSSALAQTYFERITATVCRATSPGQTTEGYGIGTTGTWVYNDGSSAAHFVCPVPDKSDLSQGNISEIRVDVDDWNNDANVTVDARVCAFNSFNGGTSGACGNWEKSDNSTNFANYTTLVLEDASLELNALGDAGETAYVWVVLPAKDGTLRSSINGLYFEDD